MSPPTDLARFVRTYPGAIDDALAADLIALPGAAKLNLDHRRCSLTPVVGDVLERFRGVVRECFADYRAVSTTLNFCTLLEEPNVLRYEPSTPDRHEWFHEHSDAWNIASATRQVSVIAYLNDVVQGGETVFTSFNYSQRCEKGTVLFFPSNFLYHHLARPPESGAKLVVVTWLHFGNDGKTTYLTTPLSGQRDRDVLLAEVERNPEDARSVFDLAQSYFDKGDFVDARKWYARRAEMGGPAEEVYAALYRLADSMRQLDAPWPELEDAYLKAWEFRPTRAEPLYAIANHYRVEKDFRLGYQFAERATQIPLPESDILSVGADVYAWRAIDEQAVCAYWIGKHAEAFTLCRRLLAGPDTPDQERDRITVNRDFSVPTMIEAASPYPDVLVRNLIAAPRNSEITVTLVAGPDQTATEQTLNSFLHCCIDLSRAGRFLVIDTGLSTQDRGRLQERYGFLEFADCAHVQGPSVPVGQIRDHIGGRFWLHLDHGWRFFAPEHFITRLIAVLEAESQVFQVGINFADAPKLTGTSAAEHAVRRAPDTGRYLLTDVPARGPAMFDTQRLDGAAGITGATIDSIAELGRRATATGLRTASLDEVLCITAA